MTLDVGTAYTATFNVTSSSGALATPSSVVLNVTQPDQTAFPGSPFTVTPALGLQQQVFTPAQSGLHKMVWATTGPTLVKTDYENFRNFVSAISLADAKARLGITVSGTDEQVRLFMGVATREAERIVGTIVPRVFTNELISGTYRDALRVANGPIYMTPGNTASNGSVTSLASAYPFGPSWVCGGTTNQLLVTPSPGVIRELGLVPFWYGPWYVTYTGGLAEIPEPIVEGVKEILFDVWSEMRGLTADIAEAAAESLNVPPYYRPSARALAALKGYEMPGFG